MKILVTGSQGTLGTVLIKELYRRGHDVWGCDLHHNAMHYNLRADVSESRQVERIFDEIEPQLVYHLAAEFGRKNGQDYYEQLWKTNCLGTRNIIEACLAYDSHLVFASSSEAYGDLQDDAGIQSEELLANKVPSFHNEYALTKYTNEKQIQLAIRNDGLKATILRFFNIYGPGEEYNHYRSVISLFIYRLLHDIPITVYKNCDRDFLYVDDWTRTVANVAERYDDFVNGKAFNIGGKEAVSIGVLAQLLLLLIPETKSSVTWLSTEENNVKAKFPSIHLASSLLNHRCSVDLEEGLRRTIAWMKEKYKTEKVENSCLESA